MARLVLLVLAALVAVAVAQNTVGNWTIIDNDYATIAVRMTMSVVAFWRLLCANACHYVSLSLSRPPSLDVVRLPNHYRWLDCW